MVRSAIRPPLCPDFQRSFVAMRYFWGARDDQLTDALEGWELAPTTSKLLASLRDPQRAVRARALSDELGRVAGALVEQGAWRC